jgi:hypothetical protein
LMERRGRSQLWKDRGSNIRSVESSSESGLVAERSW